VTSDRNVAQTRRLKASASAPDIPVGGLMGQSWPRILRSPLASF